MVLWCNGSTFGFDPKGVSSNLTSTTNFKTGQYHNFVFDITGREMYLPPLYRVSSLDVPLNCGTFFMLIFGYKKINKF